MRNKNTLIYNIRRPPFPFKNPPQEIYLRLNEPKVFKKWYKEHGHAPGYSEYLKNRKGKKGKKKVQRTSESIKNLLKLAEILDQEQQYIASDKLTKIAHQVLSHCGHCGIAAAEASCNACKASTANAMTCQACGWSEAKMCPTCLMKRFGETCPDCGGDISAAEASYASVKKAKTLTYKEKQASPCVFPKDSPKVKDNKDHYPIGDLAHGANALARAQQYSSSPPPWFAGTVGELQAAVRRAVYSKFPGLKSRKEERGDK